MHSHGLKSIVILVTLMVLLEACFLRPFGESTFEKVKSKDGKIRVTVTVDPGLSTDHVYIIRGHKWFNTTPKADFAHLTDRFYIQENNSVLEVYYCGAMLEDEIINKEDVQFIHIPSYGEFNERFLTLKKEDVVFSYPEIK